MRKASSSIAPSFRAQCVFRQPQGAVGSDQFGQIDGVDEGVGNRQAGVLGIDVNGGHVELEVGRGSNQMEKTNPMDLHSQPGPKDHPDPGGVVAGLQLELLARDADADPIPGGVQGDLHGQGQFSPVAAQRVGGPVELGPDPVAVVGDPVAHPSDPGPGGIAVAGVNGEGAL